MKRKVYPNAGGRDRHRHRPSLPLFDSFFSESQGRDSDAYTDSLWHWHWFLPKILQRTSGFCLEIWSWFFRKTEFLILIWLLLMHWLHSAPLSLRNQNMGLVFTRLFTSLFGNKEARILVLGLDNAGKTTILCMRTNSLLKLIQFLCQFLGY